MKRLAWFLALLLAPTSLAMAELSPVVDMSLQVTKPLDFDGMEYATGRGEGSRLAAPGQCQGGSFEDLRATHAFRFFETQQQTGCLEVWFTTELVSDAKTAHLAFTADRAIKGPYDDATNVNMIQHVQVGRPSALRTYPVFEPTEGSSPPVAQLVPLEPGGGSREIRFFFEDRGVPTDPIDAVVPVPTNSFGATVSEPRIVMAGIPLEYEATYRKAANIGSSALQEHNVAFTIPPGLGHGAETAVQLTLASGTQIVAMRGPEGRHVFTAGQVVIDGTGHYVVPSHLLRTPGDYTLELSQETALQHMVPGSVAGAGFAIPLLLGLVAGGIHVRHRTELRRFVPAAWRQDVLVWVLGMVGLTGLFAWAARDRFDAISVSPPGPTSVALAIGVILVMALFAMLIIRCYGLLRISGRLRHAREIESVNQDLARSNRDLAEFADTVSHDLQAPLRTVVGFTSLLERNHEKRLNKEGKEYVQMARDGAERMQGMVEGLLQFSRIGPDRIAMDVVDMNRVAASVLRDLAPAVHEKKAQIQVGRLPSVQGHAGLLGQLLTNMIDNAIKYCERRPSIRIDARPEGDMWCFSVQDNGIGIPERFQDKVFVMFQRLHGANSKYEGSGIGLSISRRIVESHGGTMWVESKEGEGSTFFFTLKAKP